MSSPSSINFPARIYHRGSEEPDKVTITIDLGQLLISDQNGGTPLVVSFDTIDLKLGGARKDRIILYCIITGDTIVSTDTSLLNVMERSNKCPMLARKINKAKWLQKTNFLHSSTTLAVPISLILALLVWIVVGFVNKSSAPPKRSPVLNQNLPSGNLIPEANNVIPENNDVIAENNIANENKTETLTGTNLVSPDTTLPSQEKQTSPIDNLEPASQIASLNPSEIKPSIDSQATPEIKPSAIKPQTEIKPPAQTPAEKPMEGEIDTTLEPKISPKAATKVGAKPATKVSLKPAAAVSTSPEIKSNEKFKKPDQYLNYVQNHLKANWHPPTASSRKLTVVQFNIQQDGQVSNAKVVKSSGNKKMDQAALKAISAAGPFSIPPKSLEPPVGIEFTFEYKVKYRRRG